jgi:TolB-like protein/DNA-binding winged helix-turn-helix (wHTH) protein/rhodanese-related sulfurtransferase
MSAAAVKTCGRVKIEEPSLPSRYGENRMDVRSGLTLAINGVTADFGSETLRDKSGNSIDLRPQAFAVLRYLSESANRLVTKDELMRAVWPGTAVTDDSLVQCIHEIRRALDDENHAVLKTVPKRGYRLFLPADAAPHMPAPVAPVSGIPARLSRLGRIPIGIAAVLVLAGAAFTWWLLRDAPKPAGLPVIAVLPFENLGADAAEGYFADGITEDLITDLSKLSGIYVIARNSVWNYRGKPVDIQKVAADLGARYVLEGSVRREAEQVRINAQLIDTVAGTHLWADRYDGPLNDVFKLQDRVIARIVSALAVELTSDEAAATARVETTKPQAYDSLLLGMDYLHRDTEADTLKAIALFEKAVALDPGYSRAYAAIAAGQLRIVLSIWYTTAGAGLDRAFASLTTNLAKAMEKPTSLSYTVAAVWALQTGRNDAAFAAIAQAAALAPNDPEVRVSKARILNATGRAAEAEAEIRLAMRLDPRFAPGTLRILSMALFQQARYQEAVDTVGRIKAQGADTTDDYITLVSSLGQLGRGEGVKEAIARYNALALPAAWDPMTVQEAQWYWNGALLSYYRPYVDKLVEGVRKAGVPEGAGMDVPLDRYFGLIKRIGGEYDVEGATEVDAATAKALRDRGVPFVDVRAHADFANGHVPGAVNLSLVVDLSREELAKVAGPDDEIAFYCHTKYCEYSAYASAKAILWGYKRVYRFAGGFPAWKDAGYPVEIVSAK